MDHSFTGIVYVWYYAHSSETESLTKFKYGAHTKYQE